MKRKMAKQAKRMTVIIVIIALIAAAAVAAAWLYLSDTIENEYTLKTRQLEGMISNVTTYGYVATADIAAGDVIDETNVTRQEIYTDMPDSLFINGEDLGLRAVTNIREGTQVLKIMVTDRVVTDDLREIEYSFIHFGANIKAGDCVDIRIIYPDGTDFVVASKKYVNGIGEGSDTRSVLEVTEEEILMIDAAAVDAYTYSAEGYTPGTHNPVKGSRIYAAKYVAPTMQEASVVNYIPSERTMELIWADPNIVEIASSYLEKSLKEEALISRKLIEDDLKDKKASDEGEATGEPDEGGLDYNGYAGYSDLSKYITPSNEDELASYADRPGDENYSQDEVFGSN